MRSRRPLGWFHFVDILTASVARRYALPWFKALFATGVGRAPASNDMEQRLENLNVFFTYFVYTNVCRQCLVSRRPVVLWCLPFLDMSRLEE